MGDLKNGASTMALVQDDLNRRNTETVASAERRRDAKMEELIERVNGLQAAMAGLAERLAVLEHDRGMALARRMGTGPSVPGD